MNHSRLRIQANTQHNSGADINKVYHEITYLKYLLVERADNKKANNYTFFYNKKKTMLIETNVFFYIIYSTFLYYVTFLVALVIFRLHIFHTLPFQFKSVNKLPGAWGAVGAKCLVQWPLAVPRRELKPHEVPS